MISDLNDFKLLSHNTNITLQEIYKKIAELDKKYSELENYNKNINGIICNFGMDIKNIYLIKYARKRLKKLLNQSNSNKLRFDLGNCIQNISEIENQYPHSITELINTTGFNEAKKEFLLVETDESRSYETALTNSAILLEKYGRNFEAILLYEKILKINPRFGMAYGNKALAIHYYISLAPQKSFLLICEEANLFRKALQDTKLTEIGGQYVKEYFEQQLLKIEGYLESHNQLNVDISNGNEDKSKLTKYQKFLLDNNLFLNFDFGYYYDSESIIDTLHPNLIEHIDEKRGCHNRVMSDRVYFSFQVFNQIIETYTTARLSYFELLKADYNEYDKMVNYTYTLDYTRHGIKYGLLKSIFCDLYNCLDKIAHLVAYYYVKDESLRPKDLYFDWLQKDVYKDIITKENSFQLLALRNLSLDFQEGYQYYNLKKLRNQITHSFLNIDEGIVSKAQFREYEITEKKLIDNVMNLLLIVKAALMYFEISVRKTKPEGLTVPMSITLQKNVFFD